MSYGGTREWELFELVRRPAEKRGYVFSDAVENANRREIRKVVQELRLLRVAGIPPDKTKGNPDLVKIAWRCRGEHEDGTFYELKCKPTGWRLYFAAIHEKRTAVVLLTVHKKTNKRDDGDLEICCTRINELRTGNGKNISRIGIDLLGN